MNHTKGDGAGVWMGIEFVRKEIPLSSFGAYRGIPELFQGSPEIFRGSPEFLRESPEIFRGIPEFLRESPELYRGSPEFLRGLPEMIKHFSSLQNELILEQIRMCSRWSASFEVLPPNGPGNLDTCPGNALTSRSAGCCVTFAACSVDRRFCRSVTR
jgi:hypothetical protein